MSCATFNTIDPHVPFATAVFPLFCCMVLSLAKTSHVSYLFPPLSFARLPNVNLKPPAITRHSSLATFPFSFFILHTPSFHFSSKPIAAQLQHLPVPGQLHAPTHKIMSSSLCLSSSSQTAIALIPQVVPQVCLTYGMKA